MQDSGRWQQEAVLLVLPLVVSLLNALMPYLFNFLAMWEKQDSPVTQVYVAIIRWAGWGCGGGSPLHLWQAGRLWGQALHLWVSAPPSLGSGISGSAPAPQEPHPEDDGSHPAVLPVAQPECYLLNRGQHHCPRAMEGWTERGVVQGAGVIFSVRYQEEILPSEGGEALA